MKNQGHFFNIISSLQPVWRVMLPICLLLCYPLAGHGQSDDFDDGNDDGWEPYDPIALNPLGLPGVASWTFPNGNSYRMQTSPSPSPAQLGPGRAGSTRTNIYSDFFMSVDIVDWDNTLDQAIGVFARVSDIGLGTTDGYSLTYQVPDNDIDITRFTDESPDGGELPLDGEDAVILTPGMSYRFQFIGKGSSLSARIFELPNTTTPLVEVFTTDSTYASGRCGLLSFDNSDGGNSTTDVTFDNYFAAVAESPEINIRFLNGGRDVFWSTNAVGFILQESTSLNPPNWVDVPPEFYAVPIGEFFFYFTDFYDYRTEAYYRLYRP